MKSFSERLDEALRLRHISAAELSRKLGLYEGTISNYRAGRYQARQERIEEIANALNVSVAWLMGADVPVVEKKKPTMIPVLGSVRAGIPIEAVEDILGYEEISEDMARLGEYFALRIRGSSMLPRFTEGDIVIVRQQADVDSGDIAIVLIGNQDATIKKIVKFVGGINLVPTNPEFEVLTFSENQVNELPVQILGKVVELRAKF